MKIRVYNNDSTDSITYEGTLEEIIEQAKLRLTLLDWEHGWSEEIE